VEDEARSRRGTWRTRSQGETIGDPWADEVSPGPASLPPDEIALRYERQELLGEGGMGAVWRYWDRRLQRPVAIKVLRAQSVGVAAMVRFQEEARITAQLQHPGIIPIHDLGWLDEGCPWFAMKEVRGRTLEAWRPGHTLRRALEVFLRVCETVAYAHARGVIHRDLKPRNLMVGDFGEVLILDWGLAKIFGAHDAVGGELPVDPGPMGLTRFGHVTGTPAYMAPEQARGESATVGPTADVYALGATLYELLTERPPRVADTLADLVRAVATASPVPPPSQWVQVEDELDRICLRALAPAAGDRYPDAGALAADLAQWLDGARQRERALALVADADLLMSRAGQAEQAASVLEARAETALDALPPSASAEDKAHAWQLQDEAASQRSTGHADRIRAVQLLRSALSHAEVAEAHDRLADHFREQHAQLEANGETMRAAAALADLAEHDRSRRHGSYLRGTGALTLLTDPPGAHVQLHRFVPQGRRLVPSLERSLGPTPLHAEPVEMGSYLLTLHLPGREVVRYPVWIRREEHWSQPQPIRLPAAGELGPEDCYLPAGWSWSGDDEFEGTLPLQRQWNEALVVRRFVVTVGEYAAFLSTLDEGALAAHQLQMSEGGGPFLARDEQGRWAVRTDQQGPVWDALRRAGPRLPAVYVNLHQARAYASWEAQRTGLGWRLPTELEWQRAGRGADLRHYPWGDHFESSWARCRRPDEPPRIGSVDEDPIDCSPFGVRGLAGNVLEWAQNPDGTSANVGGSCSSGPVSARLSYRVPQAPGYTSGRLGLRLFRFDHPLERRK
jgi:formylglycine-generating enzyme required for sulfatase activity